MLQKIEKIKEDAKKIFESTKICHDWDHTLRVYNLAVHIGKKEGGDLDVIMVAALLHDIARHEQDLSKGKVCHAERGAEKVEEYLKEHNFDNAFIDKVVHAVRTHRFKGKNIPETLEAKILFDADKLDGIGAVGIGRVFQFAGEIHARLHNPEPDIRPEAEYGVEDTAYREYVLRLSKIKDRLFTEEARSIAKERHDFMELFFKKLNNEIIGDE